MRLNVKKGFKIVILLAVLPSVGFAGETFIQDKIPVTFRAYTKTPEMSDIFF